MSRARTLLRQVHAMLRRQGPPDSLAGPPIPTGHALIDYVFECLRVEDEIIARNAHVLEPDPEWLAMRDELRDAALAGQAKLDAEGVPRQTFAEWLAQQRRGPDGELLPADDEPADDSSHIRSP